MPDPAAAPSLINREQELVAAVLRKDRKATAEFVEAYADSVYAYVARRLAPREEIIEDVVQEVFLEAWRSLARFRGDSAVRTWLLGIARHKVQDYFRERLRTVDLPDEDIAGAPATEPAIDELMDQRRAAERVETILQSLPDTYRYALVWRYWEHRSAQEMAALTGKSEKAIERLLARAREQFKRRWNGE